MRETIAKGGSPSSLVGLALEGLSYRQKTIPGRNATYGEEISRVEKEARAEIEGALDPTQAEKFEHTSIAPMLGEGGGVQMMATAGPDGAEGGLIITHDTEIAVDPGPAEATRGE